MQREENTRPASRRRTRPASRRRTRPAGRRAVFTLLAFLLCCLPAFATAHQTGKATFVVHVKPETNQIDTLLSCPALDVAHAAEVPKSGEQVTLAEARPRWNMLGFYLDKHIQVTNNGKECQPFEHKLSPPGESQVFWFLKAVKCDDPLGEIVIHNDAMTETKNGYRHLGRIQLGEAVSTTVFNAQTPTFALKVGEPGAPDEQEVPTSMGRFVWEGITHIAIGLDHVLFVLALVLMSRRLRELLIVVTAFTIAHSITLALSALDVVSLSPAVVEPVIAVSIIWMAVEAVIDREGSKRAYVATFVLGLVHGFGFSYVLRDQVGLPTDALLPALLSFNVGVELGQLAIVLVAYPLRHLIRDREWERKAVIAVSAIIGVIALYWFIERTFLG